MLNKYIYIVTSAYCLNPNSVLEIINICVRYIKKIIGVYFKSLSIYKK